MQPYWVKQTLKTPLFPSMLWSRPENKVYAGKLAIVGGNAQSFARPAEAYASASAAGAGSVRVLLPDVLQKTVSKLFPAAEFAPSTPSGSFASQALGELVPLSDWADGVLIAGDLGKNSETAVLLEKFTSNHFGQITLTCDAADYSIQTPQPMLSSGQTLLVISFAQLQKLAVHAKFEKSFTFDMGLVQLVQHLHAFTDRWKPHIVVKYLDSIVVAVDGQISSTKVADESGTWRLPTASNACVWWMQNPSKPFEALTTALNGMDSAAN